MTFNIGGYFGNGMERHGVYRRVSVALQGHGDMHFFSGTSEQGESFGWVMGETLII